VVVASWLAMDECKKTKNKNNLQKIVLLDAYVSTEQWNVAKSWEPYNVRFPTLIQTTYERKKGYVFPTSIWKTIYIHEYPS